MSLKIKKASDPIECTTIKALIYGEPGIGKTTLAMTAPRTLMVDCDGGIRRVEPRFRANYLEVNCWKDIEDILLSPEDIKEYDTIAIDTVGKLLEFLGADIISKNYKMGNGKSGGLTLQGYGALLSQFKAFNHSVSRLGKNIIYIAHDVEVKDGEKAKFRPDITGKSLGSVLREMDLVGYMQSRNNERTISFSPSDNYYGKNTCNLDPVLAVEDMNKNVKAKPMTYIFDQFKIMMESQQDVMEQYEVLMNAIDAKIDTITNAVTALDITNEIKELEEIWDSRTIARIKLQEKVKEMKLKYDKTTNTYIEDTDEAK